MPTIATLNVGNYRGMGARYVNALYRGCARNLTVSYNFVCFTDDPSGLLPQIEPRTVPRGLDGWYNKIALFHPDAFPRGTRVLYFDLDAVILGNIDGLAAYDGAFAALSHPSLPSTINSSIMAWEAGRYSDVWSRWVEESFPKVPGGDQEWIFESVPAATRLQTVFPDQLRSFKTECWGQGRPAKSRFHEKWRALTARYLQVPYPTGATVVYFHGEPKPDDCRTTWVREAWQ